MIVDNHAMAFFLMLIGIFSVLEFFTIILKIFEKNKMKQFFYNIIFIIYIFSFCTYFLILSSFLHLKILIFMVLLTCVASDIGGFIFGKIFKGPKLTKISPKKTISGAIGSLIFSSLFILMLTYYLTKNFDLYIIIIGCIISISCQIGDLFFSFLKRKSFLKDSGNFLPGHGGILDRIDGILLGIPVGFLTFLMFY
jgi:phosphatidate cytidylyltransferase